jgi:hypothetical protein
MKINRKSHRGVEADDGGSVETYKVFVVNRTDYEIYRFKVGQTGKWQILTKTIGKTCDEACTACQLAQNYRLLHIVHCDSTPYDLYLTGKQAGQFMSWGPIRITPDCSRPGESFCVE